MYSSCSVYHVCGIESSGDGPFAFTLECCGCDPATLDSAKPEHLPDCTSSVGFGVLHRGGGVDIVIDDDVAHYPNLDEAYGDFAHYHIDHQRELEFVWGPTNPEGGLSFY